MGTEKNNTFSIGRSWRPRFSVEIAGLLFSLIKMRNNQVEGAIQMQLVTQITCVFFVWCLLLGLQRLSVDFRSGLTLWPAGAFQSRHSATLAERCLMNCLEEKVVLARQNRHPPPRLCLAHLQPYLRCFSAALGCFPWIGRHWRCKKFMWRKMHRLLGFTWKTADCSAHKHCWWYGLAFTTFDVIRPIGSIERKLFWELSWINIAHYPQNISPELYIHWSVSPITGQ